MLAVDGNFTADHVKMRHPENNIGLTNGEGYMVEETTYRTHLSVTKEVKQVCDIALIPCSMYGSLFHREIQTVTIIVLSVRRMPIERI